MKHIEGYVHELNCAFLCVLEYLLLGPFPLHVSVILVGPYLLFGILVFHWHEQETIAADRDERNRSALFSLLCKIVVLGRQPLPLIAEAGSGICPSRS